MININMQISINMKQIYTKIIILINMINQINMKKTINMTLIVMKINIQNKNNLITKLMTKTNILI